MKSIFYSKKTGFLILILLSAALCRFNGAAAYPGETESRIDALDRFEMKLSELAVDPEEIRFTLTLSGNGVESEEDCEERYVEGIREENEDGEARLCRTVRQAFTYSNGGVIPADAEIVKTTLSFDDENFFQIHPPDFFQGEPEAFWKKGGFKYNVCFYNPEAVEVTDQNEESTEFMIRGYRTKERFGIYLSAVQWSVNQFAFAMTYRSDLFNPKLAFLPILSAGDDFRHDLFGFPIVDGKAGFSGQPTVAELIEQGHTDISEEMPDDPVFDQHVVYAYNDPGFGNGAEYDRSLIEPLRLDLVLLPSKVTVTYRTRQGGIGHWIGSIQNQLRIQYVYKSE